VDELVDCVTKPKYQGKLIIILAGYVEDINTLLGINPGMSSRFPESIDFDPLTIADCIQLMTSQLQAKKAKLKGKVAMDLSCLESLGPLFSKELTDKFQALTLQDSWANARDIKELATKMFQKMGYSTTKLTLTEDIVRSTLDDMMRERRGRVRNKKPKVSTRGAQPPVNMPVFTPPVNPTSTTMATNGNTKEVPAEGHVSPSDIRDAGVSDEVWEQLQKDKKKEAEDNEELRQLKKAQQSAKDAARERILREILAKEEERKKIEAKKKKLMSLGICPAGYQWTKQSGGYRCGGGAHWLSDDMIDKM
jgi:hypothetical protein